MRQRDGLVGRAANRLTSGCNFGYDGTSAVFGWRELEAFVLRELNAFALRDLNLRMASKGGTCVLYR